MTETTRTLADRLEQILRAAYRHGYSRGAADGEGGRFADPDREAMLYMEALPLATERSMDELSAALAAAEQEQARLRERVEGLERENAALRHREDLAWGLIANANGGDWSSASPEWQEAARRWQRGYEISTPTPAGTQEGTDG